MRKLSQSFRQFPIALAIFLGILAAMVAPDVFAGDWDDQYLQCVIACQKWFPPGAQQDKCIADMCDKFFQVTCASCDAPNCTINKTGCPAVCGGVQNGCTDSSLCYCWGLCDASGFWNCNCIKKGS